MRCLVFALLAMVSQAFAQVPDSGRWQELRTQIAETTSDYDRE